MSTKTAPQEEPLPQFKRFDRNNLVAMRGRGSRPCVAMSAHGNFCFSKKLSELMHLRAGAAVVFLYDETQDQWYIQRDDKNGLVLREGKEGSFQFNSSSLRKEVVDTIPKTVEAGGNIPVAEEPVKFGGITMWVLLTSGIELGRKRGSAE